MTAKTETDQVSANGATWPTVADERIDSLTPADERMDAFATADELFALKPPIDKLWIPELGKNVYIRICDGREIDTYRSSITTGKGQNVSVNLKAMRAKLAVLALGNADGTRMFQDSDVHKVLGLPSIVLERIFDRARKINGLTDAATDDETKNE